MASCWRFQARGCNEGGGKYQRVAVNSTHLPLVFLVGGLLLCRRCHLLRCVSLSAFLPTLFVQSVHFPHCSFPTRQLFQFGSVPPCFHLRPPFTADHYSFVPCSTMRVKGWLGHARSITGNDLGRLYCIWLTHQKGIRRFLSHRDREAISGGDASDGGGNQAG